jgi:hypothetical protein
LQAVDTYEGPESSDDPSYYQSFTDYEYNPNSFIVTQNFLGGFTGSSLGYDNRGRITSSYAHNSEFIYNLTYLRNSNVLQQELYGSYRERLAKEFGCLAKEFGRLAKEFGRLAKEFGRLAKMAVWARFSDKC